MSRVAERMRGEQQERAARMTPHERVQEALELGQQAIVSYAAAHNLDLQEALRALGRAGQAGRRFSRVMRDIIG